MPWHFGFTIVWLLPMRWLTHIYTQWISKCWKFMFYSLCHPLCVLCKVVLEWLCMYFCWFFFSFLLFRVWIDWNKIKACIQQSIVALTAVSTTKCFPWRNIFMVRWFTFSQKIECTSKNVDEAIFYKKLRTFCE